MPSPELEADRDRPRHFVGALAELEAEVVFDVPQQRGALPRELAGDAGGWLLGHERCGEADGGEDHAASLRQRRHD
jgi:hypothetical protein